MELIKGRPADETGRLEKEIRVYDLLDKLGMEYTEQTMSLLQQWKCVMT